MLLVDRASREWVSSMALVTGPMSHINGYQRLCFRIDAFWDCLFLGAVLLCVAELHIAPFNLLLTENSKFVRVDLNSSFHSTKTMESNL